MSPMEALTIRQAADRLGLSTQRVHQMLAKGLLDGPQPPIGRRARKGAARVYVASLEEQARSRSETIGPGSLPDAEMVALREDAHRMKVGLDMARDQISRQREQNARLVSLLADTVAALQEEQSSAAQAERITEEYAAIATNHLAPSDPRSLGEGSVPDETG